MEVTRSRVLAFRHHRQGLAGDGPTDDSAVLDLGVQDTGGPAAARWALAVRGCDVPDDQLLFAWTLRGAPHAYRRREASGVAAATAPYDDADAAKRIFDASKPLRDAGITATEALDTVAVQLHEIVDEPTVKGEVSTALTARLPEPYVRYCRPCEAIHCYEQTFRLGALRGGLELMPGTSPPVLRRIEEWAGPAASVPDRLDPIRGVLRLMGPATPKLVAGYLDAPVRTVRAHWPEDTVEVRVDGQALELLADDAEVLEDPPVAEGVRLLGAFDPWLQVRDRELLVGDEARRKDLWRTLGRPGGVLVGDEIVGTWRPRSKGSTLRLRVDVWDGGGLPKGLEEQAERLAAHRAQAFGGWVDD